VVTGYRDEIEKSFVPFRARAFGDAAEGQIPMGGQGPPRTSGGEAMTVVNRR